MPRKLSKQTTVEIKKNKAKETINSGVYQDGDASRVFNHGVAWGLWNGYTLEAKFTEAKSFRLTKDILDKIKKEATRKSHMPGVLVGIIDQNKVTNSFTILRTEDFNMMMDWIEYLWSKDNDKENSTV